MKKSLDLLLSTGHILRPSAGVAIALNGKEIDAKVTRAAVHPGERLVHANAEALRLKRGVTSGGYNG